MNKTGDWAQGYWEGKITRGEAQKVFDEFGEALNATIARNNLMDITMAFVMAKIGAKPEEFKAFYEAKLEEARCKANQESALTSTERSGTDTGSSKVVSIS